MSGIEIIGVVLGTIPLIISGLEHYQKCVKTIKDTKHAAAEFEVVVLKLQTEQLMFRNTLQILLSECLEHDTQKQLLDTLDQGWDSDKVRTALKQRLQGSYMLYIEHVQGIARTLSEFMERLHLGPKGEVPCKATAVSFRKAYKRFGFALRKSGYLDLIKEIRDDNVVLERLTGQTRALQACLKSRKLPDFESIRIRASSVFNGLQRALQTSCSEPHRVSMYLKPTVEETYMEEKTSALSEGTSFRIVLHHEVVHPKQKVPRWSIEEAEIKLIETTAPVSVATHTVVTATSTSFVRTQSRMVTFEPPKSIQSTASSTTQIQNITEIHDLCESIHSIGTMQCGSCLGYVLAGQHRHCLYSPTIRLIDHSPLSIQSLAGVLEKQQSYRLTGADARRLAVPLATGMLSLRDTPWLQNMWSRKDITLISKDGKLLSQHPFISQDVKLQAQTTAACLPRGVAAMLIKNQALFSLGIVLIELCMGKSIDDLHEQDELNADGSKGELSDFQTADRLLRMEIISDKFGKRWSDVVRRCIHCELDEAKKSLEDLGFRKAVYNKVLLELEEDSRQFFGL
ncbi:uncharacterized protein RCC_05071 [Ramularia collo-cygni]|uniref:DUF7580 domain-containing protein n=1 Tax=Ramularia collo-cygni TaxID=112498 RepID=A0A2D3UXZ9_9PEZI|nr:uncharacterized protein RCC_05071 [Ramularia collo-cygni]CZT19225.1 uncharacterized protein RCC_05071 [Ramularia collo-cygni]